MVTLERSSPAGCFPEQFTEGFQAGPLCPFAAGLAGLRGRRLPVPHLETRSAVGPAVLQATVGSCPLTLPAVRPGLWRGWHRPLTVQRAQCSAHRGPLVGLVVTGAAHTLGLGPWPDTRLPPRCV